MTGCGGCARVRSYLPDVIAKRLEEVERRMNASKTPAVVMNYTTTPPSVTTPQTKPTEGKA